MKFFCECGQKLSAPEEAVGRRGDCPACRKTFHVPSLAEAEAQARARAQKPLSRAERARRDRGPMLKWYCGCGQKLGVPESEAGQKGRCPRCHKSFRVPDPEAMRQKAERRAASALAQPPSAAPSVPTPPPVPAAAPAPPEPVPKPPPAPGAPPRT